MKKTVFIGSVYSSKVALETLLENNVRLDLVCSLDEDSSTGVSDYFPIHEIAKKSGVPFLKFTKVNSAEVLRRIELLSPDFIFVIGLSQIISNQILKLAKEYAIGFHPTPLPKHRGRAAIPWQILLGIRESKVTLFKLDEGVDSGDIIAQYAYRIDENDYASDVYRKICYALNGVLQESIPKIYSGTVDFTEQNHTEATYLLTRRPEDGRIDWSCSGIEIETLIRATSRPYPGAFSEYEGVKVVFWRAYLQENTKYVGIPGQIAWVNNDKEIAVITRDSILVVLDYEIPRGRVRFITGRKFK